MAKLFRAAGDVDGAPMTWTPKGRYMGVASFPVGSLLNPPKKSALMKQDTHVTVLPRRQDVGLGFLTFEIRLKCHEFPACGETSQVCFKGFGTPIDAANLRNIPA